jgi:twitching motility protein PilT
MTLTDLLKFAQHKRASDLHISSGQPPLLRIDGKLERIGNVALSHEVLAGFLDELLNTQQKEQLFLQKYLDFGTEIFELGRCRINVFLHQKGFALSIRLILRQIPQLEDFASFVTLKRLTEEVQGLILIVGATGSGKSTTLAAMIDYLNRLHAKHIVMLEDPIEYTHSSQKSLTHQRELGTHVNSFAEGIKAALREDPDVILIGELRDQESIRYALKAAETGHLVFATLHANSAAKALDRLSSSFENSEQNLVRLMLSESLLAIIHQTLILKANGQGRMPVQEILLTSPAIKNLIREHKIPQIEATMETSQELGMQTLAQALRKVGL